MAVLVASSDAEELVHLCDRVLVFRSGNVAVELRGNTLTDDRLVAETLGATSHRKNMRVGREPIRVRVIRSEPDIASDDTAASPEIASSGDVPAAPRVGGRFMGLVRNTLDRWRRR
jgi:hypothetical protein